MATFDDIITIVKARIPGAPDAFLLAQIQQVHAIILSMIPDLRQTSEITDQISISLTNGVRYYDLPATLLQVSQVYLYASSTARRLDPKTWTELSKQTGELPYFYRTSSTLDDIKNFAVVGRATAASGDDYQLALNVAPTAAAGAVLHVYGAQIETTMTTSTAVSSWLTSTWPYEDGLAWRAAIRYAPTLAPGYFQSFQASLNLEMDLIRTSVAGLGNTASSDRNLRTGGS